MILPLSFIIIRNIELFLNVLKSKLYWYSYLLRENILEVNKLVAIKLI
jgi:hypothetical protein